LSDGKDLSVTGLAELERALETLPGKIQSNIMRGALRAGLKPIQDAARSGIHSVSGLLARGLKVSTRSSGGSVEASLSTKGTHGPVAHLVEFGTKAHFIGGGVGGALKMPDGSLVFGVQHPGAAPRPFMRPALDSKAQEAVQSAANYIGKRLTKEGLETPAVSVEGDFT
jgi:HK97 gp10 family phage protein